MMNGGLMNQSPGHICGKIYFKVIILNRCADWLHKGRMIMVGRNHFQTFPSPGQSKTKNTNNSN